MWPRCSTMPKWIRPSSMAPRTAPTSRPASGAPSAPGAGHGARLTAAVPARHCHCAPRDSPAATQGESSETASVAPKMRKLVDAGVMNATATQVVATIYGYGGTDLLERQLDLLLDGRKLLWWALSRFTTLGNLPYRYEEDLVSRIAFRELDYAAEPDGLPLDPAVAESKARTQRVTLKTSPTTWRPKCRTSTGPPRWFPGSRSDHPAGRCQTRRVAAAQCGAVEPAEHGAQRAGFS